jgi:uncharacterized protein YggU (UPF0235/DUF167 family)
MGARFYTVDAHAVHLRVRARPGSREGAVLGARGAELVVAVRARAEKGKANEEIVRLLSRVLDIPRGEVILARGAASPHKVFRLPLAAAPRLEEWGAGDSLEEGQNPRSTTEKR